MTQLRTSCKWKFWLNKTITCFEFASCISRVIALDKEISSKAEIVKEMTIKQKKKKNAQKNNNRTTTEPVIQMLPHFPAKKQVNSYAKHLSSVFTWFFKCWTHQEIIPLKKFWKVLWFLFFIVCSGAEICFVLFLNQKKAEALASIIYTRYVNLHNRQYF